MVSKPVDRVVDILESCGFERREVPVTIGPVEHSFSAVMLGHDRSLDLVVIADSLEDSGPVLRQKVSGLARALDLVRSRRSLSVVVVGPRLSADQIHAISRVARVFSLGSAADSISEEELREMLAVLTPLELPEFTEQSVDPVGRLSIRGDGARLRNTFVRAASGGQERVRGALAAALGRALEAESGEAP